MKRALVFVLLTSAVACGGGSSPSEPAPVVAMPTPTAVPSFYVTGAVWTSNDFNARSIRDATVVFRPGDNSGWLPITVQCDPTGAWGTSLRSGTILATASAPGYVSGTFVFSIPGGTYVNGAFDPGFYLFVLKPL